MTYIRSDPDRSLTDYYPSWLDNLADDVTIEGSAMDGAAQGAEAVRTILTAIRTLYESQEFNLVGPGGVAADQDDTADGPAADLSGVVLEEAGFADGADEVELLGLIQRADGGQDCPDGLRALRSTVHRRALYGDVVRQVVQPRRVVVGETAIGVASDICHAVPPSEPGSGPDAMRGTPSGSRVARARRTSDIPWAYTWPHPGAAIVSPAGSVSTASHA